MNEDIYEETETQEQVIDRFNTDLPRVVVGFQKAAVKYSFYNEIPATISFYTLLGSIVKDHVVIPDGFNRLDTRLHFLWIQTSGTGKSTLWNFLKPVTKKVYNRINKKGSHPTFVNPNYDETRAGEEFYNDANPAYLDRVFDIFGITDYTDAALIGNLKIQEEIVIDEETNSRERVTTMKRVKGSLEGDGLAHWDEFEYSGIFKNSKHNEKSIVYLNTMMNTIHGESYIITKALDAYDELEHSCFGQRSVLAMTYPPSNLSKVMVSTGVIPRFLVYVWDVPESIQNEIRLTKIRNTGKVMDVEQPVDRFADALFKIYEMVEARFKEVNGNPLETIRFSEEYNDVLELEYRRLMQYIDGTRKEVRKHVGTFLNRMNDHLIKMAVLSCIASAPNITDPSKRFIVTGKNVLQASKIIRQTYSSLVDWVELHTKRQKEGNLAGKSLKIDFLNCFKELKQSSDDGLVNKRELFAVVAEKVKKSAVQIGRDYDKLGINEMFVESRKGKKKFVELVEGVEE